LTASGGLDSRRPGFIASRKPFNAGTTMNRYPLWKYILIAIALVVGIVYTLPNFFAEVPAVQVSTSKANVKIDASTLQAVEDALKAANVAYRGESVDATGVKVRFADPDTQLKAKDVLQQKLGDNYIVALNLLSSSPRWLASIGAADVSRPRLAWRRAFPAQVDEGRVDKTADRYLTDIVPAARRRCSTPASREDPSRSLPRCERDRANQRRYRVP
jgi:preprotein translocase subunit SecD